VNAEVADGHKGDFPHAECIVASAEGMAPPGAVIIERNNTSNLSAPVVAEAATPSLTSSVMSGGSSLLQRIQMHQQRQRENVEARRNEVYAVAVESEEARRAQLNLLS